MLTRPPPRPPPDEFREPLCRAAAPADRPPEPPRLRACSTASPTSRGRIAELADELDLHEFLDREAGKLSAGQKTRVALAKALINAPEVLLLDEPTASLDPDTGDWVRTHLETYRARARRDDPARLAQHARGRAAVRRRDHDEGGQDRRSRRAGDAHREIRPRRRWRTFSSTSRAAPASPAWWRRPMNAPFPTPTLPVYRRVFGRRASARWCSATSISCARHGRACSN